MANTSGSAADVNALATAVNTFLTANGWTQNRFDVQGSGRRLELQKTYTSGTATLTMTAGMRFSAAENVSPFSPGSQTGVFLVGGTSYTSSADWFSQAGSPFMANGTTRGGVAAGCATATISYYIFTDTANQNVVLVLGKASDVFNYISWGITLTKYGTWTGGNYFCGSRAADVLGSVANSSSDSLTLPSLPPFYAETNSAALPSSFVRIDEGGFGEEYRGTGLTANPTSSRTTRSLQGWGMPRGSALSSMASASGLDGTPAMGHLFARTRSGLTNNLLMFPLSLSTFNVAQSLWRPVGYHPLARAGYIRGNLSPGNDITVGAKTYTAFDNFVVEKV